VSHALSSPPVLAAAEQLVPLPEAGSSGVGVLADLLAGVPDPRDPRGVRHTLGAVLSVMVFAVLAGARNFREIADRVTDLPAVLLAVAGCRLHPLTGRYVVPSEPTMRRLAHDIDADAADARVCQWIREQATAAAFARHASEASDADVDSGDSGLVGVAMDGKVVRNTIAPGGAEGGEIKLFSALLHEEAVVIAQRRIPDGTNEITQVKALLAEVDLTNVVITGDAAHAQHATAAHIVSERGGAYVLTVKGNQCATRRFDTSPP
jgi:hypothetical protein